MSETTHSQTPHVPTDNVHLVKDIIMWRRKAMSMGVLTTMAALWAVMEIYGYNFITIASWIAIFLFSSLFMWANIYRLIYKEEPSMSRIEMTEDTATEMTNWIRESSEDAMRWVFKLGAQSEWYVFVATVAGLWLLSIISSSTDLLTLVFIGSVVGMIVPVIWVKYDYKIREHGKRLQMYSNRMYSMMDEKVLQKLRNKEQEKEKKLE